MALNNFFDINFPYGLKRDTDNKWRAFNRSYLPLGWHTKQDAGFSLEQTEFVSGCYPGLTEKQLTGLAASPENIGYDENGKIMQIMLYNDSCIPSRSKSNWDKYAARLEKLCKVSFDRKKTKFGS